MILHELQLCNQGTEPLIGDVFNCYCVLRQVDVGHVWQCSQATID